MSATVVSCSSFFSDLRIGAQRSCCGHGCSSSQCDRPTTHASRPSGPSTAAMISYSDVFAGDLLSANPPPRPLALTSNSFRTSSWKILATK